MKPLLTLLAFVATTSLAHAQLLWSPASNADPPPDVPEVVRLTVDPAAEPEPALRYSLLPKYGDLKPGNAAPYYYRALMQYQQTWGTWLATPEKDRERLNVFIRFDEWDDLSDQDFPREKAQLVIDRFQDVFASLRTAVEREHCDWELRFRDLEGFDAIVFRLVEFQEFRALARLLVVKSRLEILEGRHDDAIGTIQVLYRMSKDCAEEPVLINDLIGIAITSMTREEVLKLIESPGSPNLYWALNALPEPYIDLRTSMQQEMLLGENIFPFLRDADIAERTPEEWNRIVRQASSQMDELADYAYLGRSAETKIVGDLLAAARVAKGYGAAKRRLIEAGYGVAEVEAMPIGRVVAIDTQRTYRHARDEIAKWSLLPARQAWQGYRRTERELREEGYLGRSEGDLEILPIASTLLPAVGQATIAEIRSHRDRNALRVIEALRMYAAEHGRFPESLADVTDVPLPDNPWTDAPFGYRLENGTAILDVAAPEGERKRHNARVYELTLRR